jgi:hypothetical protein
MKTTFYTIILFVTISCKKEAQIKLNTQSQIEMQTEAIIAEEQSLQKNISCTDVLIEIISSSKENIEEKIGLLEFIEKRGGTSYGYMLENSPNPKRDEVKFSESYEMNFHASYPDKMTVISRYKFNPISFKLYLYNIIENDYFEIKYDEKLTTKFKQSCK